MVSNTKKREENAAISKIHYHVKEFDDKTVQHNLTYQLTSLSLTQNNNMIHIGLRGHYQIHCDPFLGVVCQSVRRIACCCESCIDIIKSEWVEEKEPAEQPHFQSNSYCKYASVFSGDEVYNDWKITETIDKHGNKKLDVDILNLVVLSGILERKIRRVLEKRYG